MLQYRVIHGILMMLAFMTFMPVGSFAAHFSRIGAWSKWFPFHRGFQVCRVAAPRPSASNSLCCRSLAHSLPLSLLSTWPRRLPSSPRRTRSSGLCVWSCCSCRCALHGYWLCLRPPLIKLCHRYSWVPSEMPSAGSIPRSLASLATMAAGLLHTVIAASQLNSTHSSLAQTMAVRCSPPHIWPGHPCAEL